MKNLLLFCFFLPLTGLFAQTGQDSLKSAYKKRVLETAEIDFMASYYSQSGENAAVSGGIGDESLTDISPTIVVSVPLNEDDVLTIDGSVSAYSSASSSNINPFDGGSAADPFIASSGASSGDSRITLSGAYSHSSDDRNETWSGKLSLSNEYDYFSFGIGGSYSRWFNEKNTEFSLNANVYLDRWSKIYPAEFRSPGSGDDEDNFDIRKYTISGNADYSPRFVPLAESNRNSYSLGLSLSQILGPKLQTSISMDFVLQEGLLSTPFQRVYFKDFENSFIENFQLADDIERLPGTRMKMALGGRANYFISEIFVMRLYYRYYTDDWGIHSHTAKLELPIKVSDKFTLYPSYRFYNQTAADHFAPFDEHLSTGEFYTSDYDLSAFNANQYGFGIRYTDMFTTFHILHFGLKSIDLEYNYYARDIGFSAGIFSIGLKFILD